MNSSNRYDDEDDSFRTDAAPPVPYPDINPDPKVTSIYLKKQPSNLSQRYLIQESTCTTCGKKVKHKDHNFNHS
jgi:hypothetical protein